jgi:hypothetical protein
VLGVTEGVGEVLPLGSDGDCEGVDEGGGWEGVEEGAGSEMGMPGMVTVGTDMIQKVSLLALSRFSSNPNPRL